VTPEQRQTLTDAARFAGRGLHPEVTLVLARRYLEVDLLPGSVVTDEMVTKAEAEVARARSRRQS
jgi:hypothetical protein